MKDKILVIGALGQVGTDLVEKLTEIYGESTVVASDIRLPREERFNFEKLDVLNKKEIGNIFTRHKPTHVYHLAAMLSATAEKYPQKGWNLNMEGQFNIFEACLEHKTKRLFWPSSIAVFGPNTPKNETPQNTYCDPTTIYGISKLAGEQYCNYYHKRYGLDVRSIRYPGLISWKAAAGGGTTDYAVEVFTEIIQHEKYQCFLEKDTMLPMMYMDDAIRATIEIQETPSSNIKQRTSYNIAGFSFTPKQLFDKILLHQPNATFAYQPDARQKIADSWPKSIDDAVARQDWNWNPKFSLDQMVLDMLHHLKRKLKH